MQVSSETNSIGGMKMQGEPSKKKSSSELYKSVDNISNKGKKSKKATGVGIYTLWNTNSAIINVSFLLYFFTKVLSV